MRSFLSVAFTALSLALTAAAASETVQGHAPNPDHCTDAKVLSTQTVSVDGQDVTVAHFACGGNSSKRSLPRSMAIRGLELEGRDQSECTDPSICKCGESCTEVCSKPTSLGPTLSNCQTIANSMEILGTVNGIGQTFFVDGGDSVLLFTADCEFEWDNISGSEIEFCWDDWANKGIHLTTDCLNLKQTAGVCKSSANDWQLSVAFV